MWLTRRIAQVSIIASSFSLADVASGQAVAPGDGGALSANVIVPQGRVFPIHRERPPVELTEVNATVQIIDQVATTTLDLVVTNKSQIRTEAELLVPVPDGAVVRGFTFQGSSAEPTARLLPKEEARRLYEAIVAKTRDPALLEFAGCNLIRSSVFPVEPRGTQKLRLTYEHVLPADGPRVDYELPRSEALESTVPWSVNVRIESQAPISTAYSPSHDIQTERTGPNSLNIKTVAAEWLNRGRPQPLTGPGPMQPGPFRLSYLCERDGLTATLFAYPDPKSGGGYFLLLTGLPATPPNLIDGPGMKRELTLVLDCSGSMAGEKFAQALAAVRQVLNGLDDGEAFNVLAYSDSVSALAPQALVKSPETMARADGFLRALRSQGGTNIHDALVEALRAEPQPNMLPIALFLTDGLPTVGNRSEIAIRTVATKSNPYQRRIFTFGVGLDVNAPLLQKIAGETRAAPVFVLPKEDVEVKVGQVFRRLQGPVVAGPTLQLLDESGNPAAGRILDVLPGQLPDLFSGDQLVVLGRYVGSAPLRFKLSGNFQGRPREFVFNCGVDKATVRNAFVPRLWASRKIGVLIDAIQALGADLTPGQPPPPQHASRLKELTDEIVRLSTEFGILTEYTAFLATEGTDLSKPAAVSDAARGNLEKRAMGGRSGSGGVSQSSNVAAKMKQSVMDKGNVYYDENMNVTSVANVQQVGDRALYRRNNRWVDSRVVTREAQPPARTIEFGTPEFETLVVKLAGEGRAATLANKGDVLLDVDGEMVLVRLPTGGE